MRRLLQVIVDSVPVILMLQNQSHTTRRPVAFLHHNTISRSRQRCPHWERHINTVMKLPPPCNRVNPPAKSASSVHSVPFRPGLREPHDLLPCYFRPEMPPTSGTTAGSLTVVLLPAGSPRALPIRHQPRSNPQHPHPRCTIPHPQGMELALPTDKLSRRGSSSRTVSAE